MTPSTRMSALSFPTSDVLPTDRVFWTAVTGIATPLAGRTGGCSPHPEAHIGAAKGAEALAEWAETRKRTSRSAPSRAPVPSLAGLSLLLEGVVLSLLVLLAFRQVGSLDIGFHLKAGERLLAGDGWPRTDPFTFTLSDRPYI